MKEVIVSVNDRLALVPGLKYVCENWGQLDYYSPQHPVQWPVALTDIKNIIFSNIGMDRNALPKNRQMGEILLSVNIADLKLTNSSAKAPALQKTQARSIWDLIELVHESLEGFFPTEKCSKLMRKSLTRVEREDGIQEYIVIYSATLNNV